MAAPDSKPTIYLFTTSTVSLYKRDLLNVCCFPDGWRIEFGYKKGYVPEKLRSNPKEALVGHPSVIIFCEPLDEAGVYYRYHPVRKARILDTRRDLDESLTLTLELGEAFNYFADEHVHRIDAFQKFIDESPDRPRTRISERSKKPNVFVRSAAAHFSNDSWQEWRTYWHPLVAYLGQKIGLNECFFMRFAEPQSRPDRRAWLQAPDIHSLSQPTWRVESGRSRNVRFEVRAGAKAKHGVPSLIARNDLVTVLGPFERQRGDGTEVDFLLSAKRIFQSDYSTFVAHVVPTVDGTPRSSEFSGVLEIHAPRWLLSMTLALLIGGTLLISFDSAILEQWFGEANRQWVFLCVKALGIIFMAVGGVIGFRKLPIVG